MFKKLGNKKMLLLMVVGFLVIIGIILLIVFGKDHFFKYSDAKKFENEYEKLNDELTDDGKKYPEVDIPSDNIIKYSNIDEILKIFNDRGNAVIYLGYPTCLYCRSAIEVLCDAASETDLDIIYYLDVEDVWNVKKTDENNKVVVVKEAHEKYDELLDILGDNLTENYVITDNNGERIELEERRLSVPTVLFVSYGQIVSYNVGTLFSQEDPYIKLDELQINGLKEIYYYGIRDVLGISNS